MSRDGVFIEFDLASELLLTVVRNQLRSSIHRCSKPLKVEGIGLVRIDHIEVPTADGLPGSNLSFASGFVRRAAKSAINRVAHGWPWPFGSTVLTDVTVHEPEIVLPLRIYILTDLMIENGTEPLTGDNLIIRLLFSVHAEMLRNEIDQDGKPKPWTAAISIRVTDVDFGDIATQLDEATQQQFKSQIAGKGQLR